MRLLFDQNLSLRLTRSLALIYPGSEHVQWRDLDSADDGSIWSFARENGFTIVSKDSDFYHRSLVFGSPPKVIWLRVGNCSTDSIEVLLRNAEADIRAFVEGSRETCLILSLKRAQ